MAIDKNNNIIFEGHVFRDSSSRLIIPDDIYDALSKSKSTSSYEFAIEMCQHGNDENDYNFYASWFILVKHDGGLKKCIKASKVKGAKDSDAINEMIQNGKMVLVQVSINSAEEVFESKLKNEPSLMEDNSSKEYYSYIEKENKSIEIELSDILSKLIINNQSDYNDLKSRLIELKDKNYFVYSKSLGYSYGNTDINSDAEKRFNILNAKIDAAMGKLEILRDENLGSGLQKNKDYYVYSDEKYPAIVDVKLKDIINDLNNYNDNDYSKIKSNFNELYNEAYSIYQLALNSATEINCMTKVLLDESIKKYKSVIEIIGKEEARLENLHNQNKPAFGSLLRKTNSDSDNE